MEVRRRKGKTFLVKHESTNFHLNSENVTGQIVQKEVCKIIKILHSKLITFMYLLVSMLMKIMIVLYGHQFLWNEKMYSYFLKLNI